ncbi:MAG: DNA repair protein RecO [Eubacteriales bacterium]|nr:DNA repair protein RecO [Eubacteriales bacterium]
MREQSKVTGIVLSVYPVGENDRRLTILTKERGKITVFARGCRKPNHPLFGVTQPLIYCEFMLTEGRSYHFLNSAEGKDFFPHLKTDLDSIYYSSYFAELAEYFTLEDTDERNVLNLLFLTFSAMKKKQVPLPLIRRIFELKIMQCCGIGPEVFQCVSCGSEERLLGLVPEEGGTICEDCKKGRRVSEISPAALYALQYVMAAPLQKLYSFSLKEKVFLEFSWAVNRFFHIHVDHAFRSAEMLDML